jgi:hypothetical protein
LYQNFNSQAAIRLISNHESPKHLKLKNHNKSLRSEAILEFQTKLVLIQQATVVTLLLPGTLGPTSAGVVLQLHGRKRSAAAADLD